MSASRWPVLIVGVGNRYMGDDGAGIRMLELLGESPATYYELMDCGTDLFTLANRNRYPAEIILMDAVRTGEPPGSIHWFSPKHVREYRMSGSVHQLSLLETLQLLPLMNDSLNRTRVSIVGIEPGALSFNPRLSEPVEQAVNHLAKLCGSKEGVEQVIARCQSTRQAGSSLPA